LHQRDAHFASAQVLECIENVPFYITLFAMAEITVSAPEILTRDLALFDRTAYNLGKSIPSNRKYTLERWLAWFDPISDVSDKGHRKQKSDERL
jgi:hypothetical protein